MHKKPIYAAFASPKGGVGKTTLTMLVASNLHHTAEYNVAVIDCNHPLYPINFMRQNEVEAAKEMQNFCDRIVRQFTKINKKAHWIVNAKIDDALQYADEIYANDDKIKLILFDLPSLMSIDGTSELLSAMDVVIFPVTGSRTVIEMTGRYIDALNEQVITMGKGRIKSMYVLLNMINTSELKSTKQACKALADTKDFTIMDIWLPYTKQAREDILETFNSVAISTLLPTENRYANLNAKGLVVEIDKIVQELCGGK